MPVDVTKLLCCRPISCQVDRRAPNAYWRRLVLVGSQEGGLNTTARGHTTGGSIVAAVTPQSTQTKVIIIGGIPDNSSARDITYLVSVRCLVVLHRDSELC